MLQPTPAGVWDDVARQTLHGKNADDRMKTVCFPIRSTATQKATQPLPSGTFLAIPVLSGKRAGQLGSGGWLGVLPNSASGGVGVEPEQLEQALLGGVDVGEDALGAGSAFVPGGVEQDGFLNAAQGRE